jgi:hypothetical protein
MGHTVGRWEGDTLVDDHVPVIGVIHVMIFVRLLNERSHRPMTDWPGVA